MKGQALLVMAVIIAALVIAFSIAQGNVNYITINNTINNSLGVIIPYANVTGGIPVLPWANITGYPGVTLPANNITNGTFGLGNYTITNNLTVLERLCLNSPCTKFMWSNGTHIIINNSA